MSPILRILIGGACIVIIVAGLRAASGIVGFLLIASLIAISLTPIVIFLTNKGVKRQLALLITILVILFLGFLLTTLLGSSVFELTRTLPNYEQRFQDILNGIENTLKGYDIDLKKLMSQNEVDARKIVSVASSLLSSLGDFLSNAIFLILMVILMIIEFSGYEHRLKKGDVREGSLSARMYEVRVEIRKFVSITALTGLMSTVAIIIYLLLLGVDFAVMWGVLFFFLNFIPAVGAIIAFIPPFLLALIQFGWTKAGLVILGFIVFNNIADNVIKPKLMKQGLDISILMIFISLLFWNWVLGIAGAILAVPLTIAIKKIFKELSKESGLLKS